MTVETEGQIGHSHMQGERTSPKINSISWGRIEIEGHGAFKDMKIHPGGAREWDWNKTGTRHSPGVQPADVQELLDHGAETIILGTGFHERLKVQSGTPRMLEEKGVDVYVWQSEEAVRLCITLRKNSIIGALIHSTC